MDMPSRCLLLMTAFSYPPRENIADEYRIVLFSAHALISAHSLII